MAEATQDDGDGSGPLVPGRETAGEQRDGGTHLPDVPQAVLQHPKPQAAPQTTHLQGLNHSRH